jgi:hypothetical protein
LPAWQFPTIVIGFILMTVLETGLRNAGARLIAASIVAAAMTPRLSKPELLISEDGELVAVSRDGRLEPNRERPPDFTFKQWQRGLTAFDLQPPTMLPTDDSLPSRRRMPGSRLTLDTEQQKALRQAMEAALIKSPRAASLATARPGARRCWIVVR